MHFSCNIYTDKLNSSITKPTLCAVAVLSRKNNLGERLSTISTMQKSINNAPGSVTLTSSFLSHIGDFYEKPPTSKKGLLLNCIVICGSMANQDILLFGAPLPLILSFFYKSTFIFYLFWQTSFTGLLLRLYQFKCHLITMQRLLIILDVWLFSF